MQSLQAPTFAHLFAPWRHGRDVTGLWCLQEYFDYIFPEEKGTDQNIKFLENALRWKRTAAEAGLDAGLEDLG